MSMRNPDRGVLLDRLPDYLNGTLSEADRREVEAALQHDASMARELEVLRLAKAALQPVAIPIDSGRIAGALSRPAAPRRLHVARWRIAAAIAMLTVGGASLAVVQQYGRDHSEPPTIVGESAHVAMDVGLAVSFGYDLSDLPAEEVEALLNELRASGGVPSAEPRTTSVTPVGGVQ